MRRALAAVVAIAALLVPVTSGAQEDPAAPAATIKAGAAVVDATWHVGAGAGQYTEKEPPNPSADLDPHQHSLSQRDSYGVQSRLTIRAIVVEGTNGERVALVKSDNYLAQDHLLRRVGQLLADGDSGITHDTILHAATHNHSSPYYASPSWGVWLFQDVVDLRMFEYQARAMARAIEEAAADLRPARMGATTVEFSAYKANIARGQHGDDGTPAGYPEDCSAPQPHGGRQCDNGVVVLRFDTLAGDPIATWVNFGQHPESNDAYDLITADFLAPLERFVDAETGAPMVFSQADVGSSEGPYEGWRTAEQRLPDGTPRAWAHVGYAQTERGARLLADAVLAGWREIGAGGGQVPYDSDFEVAGLTRFFPGPVSHPYPSVSNCRSESTAEGNPGSPILGLPDCERAADSDANASMEWENLKAHGIPVPDHYDAPGFGAVEENARLMLQAFRLGDVVVASCACEAQVDLILNFESRANDVGGDIYDGFPWDRFCAQSADGTWTCPDPKDPAATLTLTDATYRRVQAQIHNDAKGWDDPANAVAANSEPADPALVWGNFTKEELGGDTGYRLAVGVGHAGDYNGYTVSYREYMAYDHYRKALTSYGPHTADYMSTRMVRMAAALKGDEEAAAQVASEALDPVAAADEARQEAISQALGLAASAAYDGWQASLADDVGPAEVLEQPADVERFGAAVVRWRGGSNAVDNPLARVQRRDEAGDWVPFAGPAGEVVTTLDMPDGVQGVVSTRAGRQEWIWTAAFEVFDGPEWLGQVPDGEYRFVVDGHIRQGGATEEYRLESEPFLVTPWTGVEVTDLRIEPDGRASFAVPAITYPVTYESPVEFIALDEEWKAGEHPVCHTCTFRPWDDRGEVGSATVTVRRRGGRVVQVAATRQGDRWVTAPLGLRLRDQVFVAPGGVVDTWGEINGEPTPALTVTQVRGGQVTGTATGAAPEAEPAAGVVEAPVFARPVSSSRPLGVGAGLLAVVVILGALARNRMLSRRG